MEIKIEKNIPMPPGSRNPKYPLAEMIIGDSFEVTTKDKNHHIRYYAHNFGKKQKPRWEFIVRATEKGFRVWRVK